MILPLHPPLILIIRLKNSSVSCYLTLGWWLQGIIDVLFISKFCQPFPFHPMRESFLHSLHLGKDCKDYYRFFFSDSSECLAIRISKPLFDEKILGISLKYLIAGIDVKPSKSSQIKYWSRAGLNQNNPHCSCLVA